MGISENLIALRKEKHISQVELSAKSGISQQTISTIENDLNSPTVYTTQKIADALGVSLVELITGKPYPPAPPVVYSDTPLTETERQLISDFRTLNKQGRENILRQIQMEKVFSEESIEVSGVVNQ